MTMEQPPPIDNSKQEKLATFQADVAGLKEKEKKEGKTVHLEKCIPAELGEKSMELYEKFKSGNLTEKELNSYPAEKGSEMYFRMYIVNRFSKQSTNNFMDEYMLKKGKKRWNEDNKLD